MQSSHKVQAAIQNDSDKCSRPGTKQGDTTVGPNGLFVCAWQEDILTSHNQDGHGWPSVLLHSCVGKECSQEPKTGRSTGNPP